MVDKKLVTRLQNIEKEILKTIKGQDHVVKKTCEVLQQGGLGLTMEGKPKGTFLFLGPTGVGKTEFTLQFTQYLYKEDKMFRFDMSEFMHADAVKNFIGDEHGGVGRLGMVLKHHKSGTLLFDEMEKSHKQIMDLFLQILDAGRITLGDHVTYDLSKFFIVMTSNIGSQRLMRAKTSALSTLERTVIAELEKEFRPEFIGRFDQISVFRPLKYEVQKEIAKLLLTKEIKRMQDMGYDIDFDDSILYYCIKHGINEHFGARPLRRTIHQTIQSAIAGDILNNNSDGSGILYFDNKKQAILLNKTKRKKITEKLKISTEL